MHHFEEGGGVTLQQDLGMGELDQLPGFHDHDAVGVHHRVQPMSDGEDGAVAELGADRLLDLGVRSVEREKIVGRQQSSFHGERKPNWIFKP